METKEKITCILADLFENQIDINDISDDTSLIDDIGLDSLQMINFILLLEDEFNMEIDFDEIEYEMFLKFSLLVNFIEEKIHQ